MKVPENQNPVTKKRERLEMQYFKVSIAGGIFAIVIGSLTFCCDHFLTKPEQNGGTAIESSAEADSAAVSGTAVNGEGNSVVTKQAGGDYYDFSSTDTGPQEYLYEPQDFENYDKGVAYAADLIEQGKEPTALTFLMKFLQIEDLDEQMKATIEYNCGICCLHMKDYHQAVTYLSEAASKTRSPYAYYNLGCAYMDSGEYPNAEDAFKMAVELVGESGSTVASEDQDHFRTALEDVKRQTGSVSES